MDNDLRHSKGSSQARRVSAIFTGNVESRTMIHRGSNKGKAEGDIDAIMKMEKFKRDEPLVVIHGNHSVKSAGCRLVKHSIRGPGAADFAPGGAFYHGRTNDILLLGAKQRGLTGMGIQPGHGDSGPVNSEISLQGKPGRFDTITDLLPREESTDPMQWFMDCGQDNSEPRAGHHHPNPGGFGEGSQHFRMSWIRIPGILETFLADGTGDQGTAVAVVDMLHGLLDIAPHGFPGGSVRMTPADGQVTDLTHLKHRQSAFEDWFPRLPGNDDRWMLHKPGSLPENSKIPENDSLTGSGHLVTTEEFAEDFRPNAGRAAHGHGNWWQHCLPHCVFGASLVTVHQHSICGRSGYRA